MLNELRNISYPWSNATIIKNKLVPINRGNVSRGLDRIVKLLEDIENPTILEIGSEIGGSANYFMKNLNSTPNIICLDIWEKRGLGKGFFSNMEPSEKASKDAGITKKIGTFSVFYHQIKEYKDNIFPIKGDRIKSIHKIHKLGIQPDLIYVDCMHTYPECLNDLIEVRKLFPNAMITGDDYFSSNLEVMKSVEEFSNIHNQKYCVYGTQYVFPFNVNEFPEKIKYKNLENILEKRKVSPGPNSREPEFFKKK